MLILLASFLVLSTILTSLVNTYNIDVKMNSMADAAYSASMYLRGQFTESGCEDFTDYLHEKKREIMPVVDLLSINVDNMMLWVVDETGDTVLTGGSWKADSAQSESLLRDATFPESVIHTLNTDGTISDTGNLSGFFDKGHCTYGVALYAPDSGFIGAVIASTDSVGMSQLLEAMDNTVLMSTLWIMLAALIAVYFITERMVAPLKSMSRAAKSFAKGKFDARVTVTGSDEIAELAVAFNNMAENLATANEMQRSFVANVSHDLRTPMTTISGFIDGILSGAIPEEKHEYYLGVISEEVRRLSRLVTALLDISRMQAGERKFTMADFDICELSRQVLISFEQKIEAKKLDVSFECDSDRMDVIGDRDAIHQVLYNICDNAIKFSHDGGKYDIRITEKDKRIHVSVYNEGVGIPSEDVARIFDRFYKSDKSRGLDKSGVGLGMYISRTIIDAHGEKIWAESELGKWCRVTFTLPKGAAFPQRKGTADRNTKDSGKDLTV
jgi:signal transduction histidine kinase